MVKASAKIRWLLLLLLLFVTLGQTQPEQVAGRSSQEEVEDEEDDSHEPEEQDEEDGEEENDEEERGQAAEEGAISLGDAVDGAEADSDRSLPQVTCIREDGTAPAVHAAFYLWYGNPDVDGRWLHWNHKVLPHWDKAEDAKHRKFDWRPPEEPHSTFYPKRGCYSSKDKVVLAEQFLELRQAGVDSAMCSWWGRKDWEGKRDDADSGANTDEIIPAVLEAASAARVFVSFHIEPYGGRSAETFLDDLKYIHKEYGNHPAVWREGPRKLPLFWLYDVSAQHSKPDVKAWRAVLDSVRGTELDGIFLCLWIGNGGGNEDLSFVTEGGFDGAYTYFAAEGFTPGSNTKSWSHTVEQLKRIGKLFVPAVGPGYDDTNVRPWNAHNVRSRKNGAYYSRMWDAGIKSRPHAISVTSYNEWGEGTQIESAVRYRSPRGKSYQDYGRHEENYYLEETRRHSDEWKADQCASGFAKPEL